MPSSSLLWLAAAAAIAPVLGVLAVGGHGRHQHCCRHCLRPDSDDTPDATAKTPPGRREHHPTPPHPGGFLAWPPFLLVVPPMPMPTLWPMDPPPDIPPRRSHRALPPLSPVAQAHRRRGSRPPAASAAHAAAVARLVATPCCGEGHRGGSRRGEGLDVGDGGSHHRRRRRRQRHLPPGEGREDSRVPGLSGFALAQGTTCGCGARRGDAERESGTTARAGTGIIKYPSIARYIFIVGFCSAPLALLAPKLQFVFSPAYNGSLCPASATANVARSDLARVAAKRHWFDTRVSSSCGALPFHVTIVPPWQANACVGHHKP